jgi:hypothetical protein
MIIYCSSPFGGDTSDQKLHQELIKYIENLEHTVLSAHSGKFSSSIPLTEKQMYKRSLKWIDGSKLMIAEISGPSIGVGFEISYAIFKRKIPVLVLCTEDFQNISSMLYGCDSPLLTLRKYKNIDDMKSIVKTFISKIDRS